jgi:hypothetical protein
MIEILPFIISLVLTILYWPVIRGQSELFVDYYFKKKKKNRKLLKYL